MRRDLPAQGLFLAFLLGIAFLLGRLSAGPQLDDAYITYRYARNVAAGIGLVYNAGERVLATTTPLFALLLGGLGRLGLDIPTAGYALSVLSLGVAAFHLFRIGARSGRPGAGALAALLTISSADLVLTFGLESTFYLAILTGAIWAALAGRHTGAGVLFGLATLIRGDAILAGTVLVAHALVTNRRLPIRLLIAWGAVVLPWAVFAAWYFGSPLPSTLAAKVLQGQSSFWLLHFWSALPAVWMDWHVGSSPTFWLLIPLWLIGLAFAVLRDRTWLIWPAWGALYLGAYGLLNVPSYYWHYAPLVPVAAMLAGLGIDRLGAVAARLARRAPPEGDAAKMASERAAGSFSKDRGADEAFGGSAGLVPRGRLGSASTLRAVAVALLVTPLLVGQAQFLRRVLDLQPYPFYQTYRELGERLRADLPPDASLGTLEVGLVGFYSGRPMVDFAGLLQPEVARHVARDDFLWAIDAYEPDYVLWNPQRDRWLTGSTEFSTTYATVWTFPNAYLDPLVLSKRVAPNGPRRGP
jgi:hypothetical protein